MYGGLDLVAQEVELYYRIDNLFNKRRFTRYVQARWTAFTILRLMGWSYIEIAEAFNMDHTTVMHGTEQPIDHHAVNAIKTELPEDLFDIRWKFHVEQGAA